MRPCGDVQGTLRKQRWAEEDHETNSGLPNEEHTAPGSPRSRAFEVTRTLECVAACLAIRRGAIS